MAILELFKAYETYLKIGVILVYSAFIWHCHTIYDRANQAVLIEYQLTKAQTGQVNSIKLNTELQKVYVKVKAPCLTQPVPADLVRLLK